MANFFGEFVAKLVLEVKDFRARLREAAQDAEQEAGRVGKATKELGDAVKEAIDGQVGAATAARAALALLGPAATVAAGAAAVAVAAFEQGRGEARAYERAITDTGNAAGVTANSLADMARSIDASVGTQALAAQTLAELAGSGKVAGENMQFLAQTAIEADRSMGQSIDSTVGHYAKLADAPVKASLQLNDSMNYLTAATFAQIKAAEDLGDKERAAALAQESYAGALRDRAAEAEKHLGTLQRAWRGVKDAAKGAWDAMLNIGREQTTLQRLEQANQNVQTLEEELRRRQGLGYTNNVKLERNLDVARGAAWELQQTYALEEMNAAAKEAKVKLEKDHIAFISEGEKYLDKQAKMERAVEAERRRGQDLVAAGLLTQEALEKRIAQVRESYAEKGKSPRGSSGKSDLEKQLEAEAAATAKAAGVNTDYLAQLKLLESARDRGRMSEAQYVEAVEHLIAVQPSSVKLTREQAEATKAAEKAAKEAARGHEQYMAALSRGAQDAQRRADALEVEERAAAIAAGGYYSLAQAVELVTIARLKEKQEGLLGNEEAYLAVQREIDARERLVALIGSKEARTANEKAAKDAERTWDQTAKTVGDSLQDYIMGGGRNAAQYLKRLFATLVLQPRVQAFAGSIMGTGPAAAADGSNMLGLAGNANSLAGMNTGWLTNFGATLPGSIASTGAQLYSQGFETLGNGLMDFGNSIAGYADALNVAGDVLGYGSAIFAAANGKWGQAIGSAVGTYFGGPIGSFIGSTIGKWADKIFSGGAGTPHTGGAGSYSAAGGQATGLAVLDQGLTFGVGERYYNSEAEKAAVGISQGIVQLLDSTAQSFGQQAGYFAATAFADDSSKDGAWGSLRIMRGDEKVLDWADTQTSKWAPKEFSDGEAGQKEYAAAIAASARDALKTALGDADWAKDMLDTLGDGVTLESLGTVVAQINQAKASFVSFGQYMPTFAGLAQSAVSAMVDAAGGVGPLSQGMATFVENFYSDADKLAVNTENVRAALEGLGFDMPRTRDEFKALVQAQIALGDAGAKTAAGLLGLSGAVAAVLPAAEAAQAGIASVSEQLQDAFGMTADAISGILNDAVTNAQTASEAQRMAAQAFEEQFYGGAMSSLTDSLGAMLQSSVIAPMMESLVAGSAASASMLATGGAVAAGAMASGGAAGGAASAAGGSSAAGAMASGGASAANAMVSGGSAAGAIVASAVEQARAQVNAYAQILSDPDVQAGIKDISKLVGDVAGMTFNASRSWGGGGGYSGGVGGSAGGAASEADKLADALERLGETMSDEVKRLRGLMVEDSGQSREVLLARFTTATAAARAGDKDALEQLPKLSRDIEAATANAAATAVDVARMRAWLATSLEQTLGVLGLDVPALAVGTNYVPHDMLAFLHKGEAVVPEPYNPDAGGDADYRVADAPLAMDWRGGADAGLLAQVLQEIQGLRRDLHDAVQAQEAQSVRALRMALRGVRVAESWELGGLPATRKAAVEVPAS